MLALLLLHLFLLIRLVELKLCIFAWQVVEISKGSKVKYELDKASGLIKVMPLLLIHPFHMFLEVIVSYMVTSCIDIHSCCMTMFFIGNGFFFLVLLTLVWIKELAQLFLECLTSV